VSHQSAIEHQCCDIRSINIFDDVIFLRTNKQCFEKSKLIEKNISKGCSIYFYFSQRLIEKSDGFLIPGKDCEGEKPISRNYIKKSVGGIKTLLCDGFKYIDFDFYP